MRTSIGEIQLDLVLNLKDIDKKINSFSKGVSNKFGSCFSKSNKILQNSFSSSSSKIEDLKNKISQTEKEISKLTDEMSRLSNVTVSTKETEKWSSLIKSTEKEMEELSAKMKKIADTKVQTDDYKEVCNFYESLNKRLNTLIEKQEKFKNTNVSQNSKQWKNLQYDIDEVKKSILYAKGEIADMNSSGTAFKSGKQTEEYKKIAKELGNVNKKLKTYEKNYNQAFANAETKRSNELLKKSIQLDKLCDKLDVYKMKLQETSNKEKGTSNSSSKASKSLTKFGDVTKKTTSSITKLSNSVKFLGKMFAMSIMFQGISYALSGIKEGFDNLVQYSSKANKSASMMATSMLQLKNALAAAFQPIMNAIVPYLQIFINYLIKAIDTIGKFFTVLLTGGNTYTRAKQAQVDYAKSLANTGKTAKKTAKEVKSIMSFDSLNTLSSNNTDNSSDTDTDSGTPSVSEMFEKVPIESSITKAVKKLKKALEALKEKLKPTADALKSLYDNGLKKLGNFTWKALKDFYKDFLVPVGNWMLGKGLPDFINATNTLLCNIDWNKINTCLDNLWKALAPFAINVGEGLLWFYKNALVPIGTWVANEVVPRFLDTLSIAIKTLNGAIEALTPLAKSLFDNLLVPIAKWTADKFLSIWDSINNILLIFSNWCQTHPGTVQGMAIAVTAFFGAWKTVELLSFIQQSGGVVGALKKISVALFASTIKKTKDIAKTAILNTMYAKDFVKSVAQSVAALAKQATQFTVSTAAKVADTVAQAAMTAATVTWNAVCALATTLTTALGTAIAFLTSPMGIAVVAITALIAAGITLYKNWNKVKEIAIKVWNKIKEIFNKFGNWLTGVFRTVFSKSFDALGENMNSFMQNVKNIWNSIKTIFKGIITFISGTFKGDWKKAWRGVKTIFKGIFDGLVDVAKAPLNLIIGLINTMLSVIFDAMNWVIKKINKLSFKVPDWVKGIGGKTFGFNIDTIDSSDMKVPYLASGGYVKANTPQLAMIGDNRHQGEVVAPENKLQSMVDSAVSQNTAVILSALRDIFKGNSNGKDIELTVNIGNRKLMRDVLKAANNGNKRMGKSVYNVL